MFLIKSSFCQLIYDVSDFVLGDLELQALQRLNYNPIANNYTITLSSKIAFLILFPFGNASVALWINVVSFMFLYIAMFKSAFEINTYIYTISVIVYTTSILVTAITFGFNISYHCNPIQCTGFLTFGAVFMIISISFNFFAVIYLFIAVRYMPSDDNRQKQQRNAIEALGKRLVFYPAWQSLTRVFYLALVLNKSKSGIGSTADASWFPVWVCFSVFTNGAGIGFILFFIYMHPEARYVLYNSRFWKFFESVLGFVADARDDVTTNVKESAKSVSRSMAKIAFNSSEIPSEGGDPGINPIHENSGHGNFGMALDDMAEPETTIEMQMLDEDAIVSRINGSKSHSDIKTSENTAGSGL